MKFLDCCAGIGTAHFAFKVLGVECIGFCEIDNNAIKTYTIFHGDYYNYGNVMNINIYNIVDFDILVAGFPCQTFSIVGKRDGFADDRGQIIYGIMEIIKIKQPKGFILENVKGLVSLNKGAVLKEIIAMLKECGYNIYYKVLNSFDFGIPQSRERIYIVGVRKDINKTFSFPTVSYPQVKLDKYFIDDESYIISDKQMITLEKYLLNKYNYGKYDLNKLLKEDYLVLDTRQSDLRLYREKIPTLRTGRQGILYIRNKTIRKLSGREALLLQGINLDSVNLILHKQSDSTLLAQAGNAMTVNVMVEIGKNLLEVII